QGWTTPARRASHLQTRERSRSRRGVQGIRRAAHTLPLGIGWAGAVHVQAFLSFGSTGSERRAESRAIQAKEWPVARSPAWRTALRAWVVPACSELSDTLWHASPTRETRPLFQAGIRT